MRIPRRAKSRGFSARTPRALLSILAGAVFSWGQPACLPAATWREDFSADPRVRGWSVHGNPGLFRWDAEGGRLAVTWDSTQPNAFFYRSLATVLTRSDTFELGFTLHIEEIRMASPRGTFQLAIGMLRRADAFRPNFFRGAGTDPEWGPRNLIEFAYFPASGAISPTFSAVALGTNSAFQSWATIDLFPLLLEPGHRFDIRIRYEGEGSLLRFLARRDDEPFAEGTRSLGERFGDFRVDAFAVMSYSGEHQPADYGGEIYARGWVDDIEVNHPDPPEVTATLAVREGVVQVGFGPVPAGWQPMLERSHNLGEWSEVVGEAMPAPGGWVVVDATPLMDAGAYRVRLDRP